MITEKEWKEIKNILQQALSQIKELKLDSVQKTMQFINGALLKITELEIEHAQCSMTDFNKKIEMDQNVRELLLSLKQDMDTCAENLLLPPETNKKASVLDQRAAEALLNTVKKISAIRKEFNNEIEQLKNEIKKELDEKKEQLERVERLALRTKQDVDAQLKEIEIKANTIANDITVTIIKDSKISIPAQKITTFEQLCQAEQKLCPFNQFEKEFESKMIENKRKIYRLYHSEIDKAFPTWITITSTAVKSFITQFQHDKLINPAYKTLNDLWTQYFSGVFDVFGSILGAQQQARREEIANELKNTIILISNINSARKNIITDILEKTIKELDKTHELKIEEKSPPLNELKEEKRLPGPIPTTLASIVLNEQEAHHRMALTNELKSIKLDSIKDEIINYKLYKTFHDDFPNGIRNDLLNQLMEQIYKFAKKGKSEKVNILYNLYFTFKNLDTQNEQQKKSFNEMIQNPKTIKALTSHGFTLNILNKHAHDDRIIRHLINSLAEYFPDKKNMPGIKGSN